MKFKINKILIIWLMVIKTSSCEESPPKWQNGSDNTKEFRVESVEVEKSGVTAFLQNSHIIVDKEEIFFNKKDELNENNSRWAGLKSNITFSKDKNLNFVENELVQIVLKDESFITNNQTEFNAGTKGKDKTNASISLESSNLTESALTQIVLRGFKNLTNNQEEDNNADNSTERLIEAVATSTAAVSNLTMEPLIMWEAFKNSKPCERDIIQIAVKDVTNLTHTFGEIENTAEVSTESLDKIAAKTTAESSATTNPLNNVEPTEDPNFVEREIIRIVLMDSKNLVNNQEKDKFTKEISTESSAVSVEWTTPYGNEKTTKYLITLEEYAVRQMNFILDHLLKEIQDFVAKVLEANVHTDFQKDPLKRYAEEINHILNADSFRDFSNEVIKNTNIETLDEIYEKIVKKLNFLRSKSTKLLHKTLPQGWINDYGRKKSELIIWLDKASNEMHSEFNCYVTAEENHLKYQYFNETFDDISRATEMHHKLALLLDLVKNVKNKKQITFMDLYMQT